MSRRLLLGSLMVALVGCASSGVAEKSATVHLEDAERVGHAAIESVIGRPLSCDADSGG